MSAKKSRIVVLDTNIIISGLLDGYDTSYPSKIISAWFFGELQVAISQDLKQELNQVLNKPYISQVLENKKSIRPVLGRLLNKAVIVFPASLSEVIFPDKTDHFLLELAVTAKAEIIVTGDKKLLNVKKVKKIQILSPKQFCMRFKIR